MTPRIVLFGPPAVGKGTLGRRLATFCNVPHVVVGDLVRTEIWNRTALGLRVEEQIAQGFLLDDETIASLVEPRLQGGFVLDGYPRTLAQAVAFDRALALQGAAVDAFVLLQASSAALASRTASRFATGSRPEDSPEVAPRRHELYRSETLPAIERYRGVRLHVIDAEQTPSRVLWQTLRVLNSLGLTE